MISILAVACAPMQYVRWLHTDVPVCPGGGKLICRIWRGSLGPMHVTPITRDVCPSERTVGNNVNF